MPSYSVNDVERVLRLSRSTIRGLVEAGFVHPERGTRREYRFSFRDMIVMRTARALIEAKVPRKRIRHSLEDLRAHLPEAMPLSGLSICAVGDRVVVREGKHRWQVDNGQYLLGLDVMQENGMLRVVERLHSAANEIKVSAVDSLIDDTRTADQWFSEALHLERADLRAARVAYEHAVRVDPQHVASWINWGRLLHEQGAIAEADGVYRRAIDLCGPEPLLMFNRGVLLEDLGDPDAALEAYHSAVEEDPQLADCHYNLARLYQELGKPQHAIRHLGQYRRLVNGPSN
jgi:tetratricopeptide (TPR) repeat protein